MAITTMLATRLPPITAPFELPPLEDADEGEGVTTLEAVGVGEVPVELVVLEINPPGPISGLSKKVSIECEAGQVKEKRGILPPTFIDLSESQEFSTCLCC